MAGHTQQQKLIKLGDIRYDSADRDTEVFLIPQGTLLVDRRWLALWFAVETAVWLDTNRGILS